jgi:hypothetical protein
MNDALKTLSRIFARCFIFSFILAGVWFALYMLPGTFAMQMKIFDMTEHECDLLTYSGIGLLKLVTLVFFFFPWLAIRMELRRRQ